MAMRWPSIRQLACDSTRVRGVRLYDGSGPVQRPSNSFQIQQTMSIELTREARAEAIKSIERYFQENMEERIGNIAAGALLNFFVEEVGPVIYNQAVAQVQERLQMRVSEIDIDVHEEEFQYWRKFDRQRKGKK